jgi:hypothetical protein
MLPDQEVQGLWAPGCQAVTGNSVDVVDSEEVSTRLRRHVGIS